MKTRARWGWSLAAAVVLALLMLLVLYRPIIGDRPERAQVTAGEAVQ